MPLPTPSSPISNGEWHSQWGQSIFMGRLGTMSWLGVQNRVCRITSGLPTGWHDGVSLMLLSDVLIQEGSQMAGLVLKQRAGPGCEEAEPSYQLPLHQGQAGKLGVVDEALPAEDGVINAATWKNRGSARLSQMAKQCSFFSENNVPTLGGEGQFALHCRSPLSAFLQIWFPLVHHPHPHSLKPLHNTSPWPNPH